MESLGGGSGVEVPWFVLAILRRSSEDLQRISGLLRNAGDLEWVSDVAALYLMHLDRVRRLVLVVDTRIDSAETAVCALSRSL